MYLGNYYLRELLLGRTTGVQGTTIDGLNDVSDSEQDSF